ncbi:MAG: hypothetical protein IT293_17150 [Deltaproteobacteria bacterium]|nr:hypothetical protein [Deltaproteobacteria bacterium]
MILRRPALVAVLTAVALAALARAAAAMTALPVDLPAMTGQAARIFVGRVERVTSGRDPHGLPATWTTFRVSERLKGPAEDTITVKQLGTSLGADGAHVLPHPALPRYHAGESVVLFVHPESALGFTSPVGLGQGCFHVRGEPDAAVVENEVGNQNLAPPTAPRALAAPGAATPSPGPVPLATFLSRVRGLVDAGR